ncbi:hemolysin family protein [Gulosibacter molinativorax]|uniref:HlyC/CorC family transporter n=1 Tax=Gulosibacter molinativorax TaxID=256821 RepID=A0ABT7C3V0_9MICO|nr:hemolysin family protein [Gulosibacter molinativorax]MDJ1369911.1 HlyC/CorC family transporter [Gulosibacter molinativorax]QUY61880.1 Hemolysin C [Gulosibacter molinativorax]
MSSDFIGIVWLVVLLAINAFFVAAEFAVITARRSSIEPRAEQGSKAAQTALFAMEHATLMLATSQLGITVCSLLILNVSEPAIHHLLVGPLAWTGMSTEWVNVIGFVITLVLVTYLHVVFGEMVPKNIAFSIPDRAVLILAPPLVFIARIFNPVIWFLNEVANLVLRAFGVTPKSEATSTYTFDEVAVIVEQSKREGVLTDEAGTLSNTFEFTTKKVGEVAVSIENIYLLDEGATPHDVQRAVAEKGFSRYIIAHDGEPVGYVHLKDLIGREDSLYDEPIPAEDVRSLTSMYVGTELEDALASLRRTGKHLARVIDKSGKTLGILFLEDVIEELVGEVRDATARR